MLQQPFGGHAADMVTDLVVGDVRPDRGHHAGEVGAQLRQLPVEARVAAERDEDVGEVDAGRGDRDLDLSRSRRNPVERDEFHRSAGHRACGSAGAYRRARGRRRWFAVRRGAADWATGVRCTTRRSRHAVSSSSDPLSSCGANCSAVRVVVHVDLGGAQVRMLGVDHPHQATQSGLLQVGHDRRPARVWAFLVTT